MKQWWKWKSHCTAIFLDHWFLVITNGCSPALSGASSPQRRGHLDGSFRVCVSVVCPEAIRLSYFSSFLGSGPPSVYPSTQPAVMATSTPALDAGHCSPPGSV